MSAGGFAHCDASEMKSRCASNRVDTILACHTEEIEKRRYGQQLARLARWPQERGSSRGRDVRAHLFGDDPAERVRLGQVRLQVVRDPVVKRLDSRRVLGGGSGSLGSRGGGRKLASRGRDVSSDRVTDGRGRRLEQARRVTMRERRIRD